MKASISEYFMTVQAKAFWRYLAFSAAAFLAVPVASAQAVEPPAAIRVDGHLNDAAWEKARAIEAFKTFDGRQPQAATSGSMLTDENYLYLAFRCEEPMMEKLEATPFARDGKLWTNDCIEIYIAPFAREEEYYQIIVDTNGQVFDAFKRGGTLDTNYDLSVTAQVQKQQNGWTLEVAIPLQEIGLSQARNALMNFGRERKPVTEFTSWHGLFGKPETWQPVQLALDKRYKLEVRDWSHGAPTAQYGGNDLTLEFVTDRAMPIRVLVQAQQKGKWVTKKQGTVRSTPGRAMRVAIGYELLPQDDPRALRFVLDADGQSVFSSTYRLSLPKDALVVTPTVPYYYSEENHSFVQLGSFISDAGLKKSRIRLTVKSPDGKVRETRLLSNLRKSMQVGLDISSWQSGTGSLTAELITDGKLMAKQNVLVHKRPGPFAKVLSHQF